MIASRAGELAALGTAICWTITAMAFESAGKRIGSLAVNLIRLVLGLVFLTLYCWIVRGQALPTDADAHAWGWLTVSGLIGFTLGDLFLFRAFVLVGSRISVLIMSLVPLFSALFGWILMQESLNGLDWLGMGITLAGVIWVVLERKEGKDGERGRLSPTGIGFAVLGALGQAVGLVFSKYGMRDYDPFAATQIRVLAGIAGFAVLFSLIGWWGKTAAALSDRGAMVRTGVGAFFGPFLGGPSGRPIGRSSTTWTLSGTPSSLATASMSNRPT